MKHPATLAVVVAAIAGLLSCSRQVPRKKPQNKPAVVAPTNRLLFAGDVMLSRAVRRQILAAKDPALPFRKLAATMAAADICFINLESPFSDRGPYYKGGLIFHAAPESIAGLQLAGVDIASTANNHARDCGPYGVEFTYNWLVSHGIQPVGTGPSESATHRGVIIVRHGIRFGFLGYTYDQSNGNWRDIDPRIAVADPQVLAHDIVGMKPRADIVIVSMHHGIEYMSRPSEKQIAFAHSAIDNGATLVIGHHPHVIAPVEKYKGGLIVYSLGNFVFDQYQRAATQHGELLEAIFTGSKLSSYRLIPVKITPTGPQPE